MGRQFSYELRRSGQAPAEVMFDLLRDVESWTRWAGPPITYAVWRDGTSGVGESVVGRVRLVGTPRFQTAEEVTVDDRPHAHGYRILANWPVRDYHSRVELVSRHDGSTEVRWSGEFVERIPGTGWLWKRFLVRFLGRLGTNLILAAQESAPPHTIDAPA
jgi:hypothetical protein